MKILILGGSGMLGHKIFQQLRDRFEMFATFRGSHGLGRLLPVYAGVAPHRLIDDVDAADFDSVASAIARTRPDIVINCIGIVKQRRESSDPLVSIGVNALFPHRLAQLCAAAEVRMLHISTDCVFSGKKGNYSEDDVADAEDLYGRTKFLGEVDRPGCLTIRTSIIGRDFLKSDALLEWLLSRRGRRVPGYRNAIYSGLTTQALARMIGDIIADHSRLSGVYQIASDPIRKYDLLLKIKQALDLEIEIDPHEDPPCDRSLSAHRFVRTTNCRIPTWDDMILELAADDTPYDEWRQDHAIA